MIRGRQAETGHGLGQLVENGGRMMVERKSTERSLTDFLERPSLAQHCHIAAEAHVAEVGALQSLSALGEPRILLHYDPIPGGLELLDKRGPGGRARRPVRCYVQRLAFLNPDAVLLPFTDAERPVETKET